MAKKLKIPKAQFGKSLVRNLKRNVNKVNDVIVNPNSGDFTKFATKRADPVIGGYAFKSIKDEYDWLQNANAISDKFVIAKNAVYNPQGEMISYDMPDLRNEGYMHLGEYMRKTSKKSSIRGLAKAETSITDLLKEVNKEGLFHLDLHGGNIMVKPGFDGKVLDYKIIDPVGLPRITSDLDFTTFDPVTGGSGLSYDTGYEKLQEALNPSLSPENTQADKYKSVMDFYSGMENYMKSHYIKLIEMERRKAGGELPKAQFGKGIKFPIKVKKKLALDGRYLPIKKINNVLSRNFTKGEQYYLQNAIAQNPSLMSEGKLDLDKLELLANENLINFKFTDHSDLIATPGNGGGVNSKWRSATDGEDFGMYNYHNLLPSQIKAIDGQYDINYGALNVNPRIIPQVSAISAPALVGSQGFLNEHHDGIGQFQEGTLGWYRGFVDQNYPNQFNLTELQNDLYQDGLNRVFSNSESFGLRNSEKTGSMTNMGAKVAPGLPSYNEYLETIKNKAFKSKLNFDKNHAQLYTSLNDKHHELEMLQAEYGAGDGNYSLDNKVASRINELQQEIQGLQSILERQDALPSRSNWSRVIEMPDLMQTSRLYTDPTFKMNNEFLSHIQDKGFNQIVLPNKSSLGIIENWPNPDNFQSVVDKYNKILPMNSQLQNTGLNYNLDNYGGGIFDLQRKNFPPFKEYGGQTTSYALDTKSDETYKTGGTVYKLNKAQKGTEVDNYETEYDQFETFLQEEETSWDYVKNTNSAVLKPDGKTYYKMYEDGLFYPYYLKNSDGTFEDKATIGFGKRGDDVYKTYKGGMSLEVAEDFRTEDIDNALRKTKIFVDANYGENAYDDLPASTKFMLADYTYNLGKLSKYPKFADAIMTGNTDAALEHYIRNDEAGGSPLARNDAYLKQYLQPWVDNTIEMNQKKLEDQNRKIQENLRMQEQFVIPADNTMVGPNSFGGWKAGGELPKAQNGFSGASLLSNQPKQDPLMTQMQNLMQQDRANKYYEPFGGEGDYNQMAQWAQYQDALASGNESVINAYKSLYPEFENMSYSDAFALSRKSQEFASPKGFGLEGKNNPQFKMPYGDNGMPNFRWNNQPYSIEEGDDNILDWRSTDEIVEISKLIDEGIDMNMLINNPDLTNASGEDYYNYMIELYKDDKDKSRLLRDIKKKRPKEYTKIFNATANSPLYNQLRTHQGKDNNTNNNDNSDLNSNSHLVDQYLMSKEFNKGPESAKEFAANYNEKELKEFKSQYLNQYFMNSDGSVNEEDMNNFLEYDPSTNSNDLYNNINLALNNQINVNNIGQRNMNYNTAAGSWGVGGNNARNIYDFGAGDMSEELKDRRMALLNNQGARLNAGRSNLWGQTVPVTNERSNQPTSWYERNISKPWNDVGQWANAPQGAPPLSGFIYNTLDWAGDIARPAIINSLPDGDYKNDAFGDARYYGTGKRFMENPTLYGGVGVGLDAAAVLAPYAGSLRGGLINTARNSRFMTQGLNFNKGMKGNYNMLKGNYKDLQLLNKVKKVDNAYPGAMQNYVKTNHGGNFNFTSNNTNRLYNFNTSNFSNPVTNAPLISGKTPWTLNQKINAGLFPGYAGYGIAGSYTPQNNITFKPSQIKLRK